MNLKAPTFPFLFFSLFLGGGFQIAVWNSYKGMNLTETNRDKNNNVTDSLANRTLIVTTILVRKEVKQRAAWVGGAGGCNLRDLHPPKYKGIYPGMAEGSH